MDLPPCSQEAQKGHLYVVSTPIGNLSDITLRAVKILSSCDLIACEDTRVTKHLLIHFGIQKPLLSYRDANEKQQAHHLIDLLKEGNSIALVSDAGTPTLSDPGFRVVRECRKIGLPVIPIPGPSAMLAALAASGLPSNDLHFVGFLPPKSTSRKHFLSQNISSNQTIILYESSHRIAKFMDDLLEVLDPKRVICLAKELTKQHETFFVGSLQTVHETFKKSNQKGEFVIIIAPSDFEL